MITIREHQKIDTEKLQGFDLDRLKERINYNASCFNASEINLMRYEFEPTTAHPKDGFYSYFRIGAEWIDTDQTEALIVLPKIERIDFIEMFVSCLRDSDPDDNFSEIYNIDLDAKPIRSAVLNSILSPLLIVQFLMTVRKIAERGLRKGYANRERNLNKMRGRIDFRKNEVRNIWAAHKERIYCRFDEFSADTPENRYLKRALLIASGMIRLLSGHKYHSTLHALCSQCLSAFEGVADSSADLTISSRNNKLFREYTDALRFARMIIRKEELAINSRHNPSFDIVPVFRIDMALLFEHYVLAKLREYFGSKNVIYQAHGSNAFIPDFLINRGEIKVIADSKYTAIYDEGSAKGDYIKQLCGYSRDIKLLRHLDIDCDDEDSVPIVPCTLIYPDIKQGDKEDFSLLKTPNNRTVKFFTTSLPIPMILPDSSK